MLQLDFRVLLRWRLGPGIGNCAGVEGAHELGSGESLWKKGWRVDFVVRLRGIMTGVFEDYCVLLSVIFLLRDGGGGIESSQPMPPGCSGANSVMSHTWPSTTIQRSFAVLCLAISSVDRSFGSAIEGGVREGRS